MARHFALGFLFAAGAGEDPCQAMTPWMSMDDMMIACREHCQMPMTSMEDLAKTMTDARASNHPAKMRAALEQAEKPLADMCST